MSYGKSTYEGAFPNGFLGVMQGSWLNAAFEKVFQGGISRQDNITAYAGGGKANATALTTSVNRITTCATSGDSVLLPKAIAGSFVVVMNEGARTLAMYGAGTDTVDDNVTANPSYLAAGDEVWLACVTRGVWNTLTAPGIVPQQTLAAAGATQGNAAQITGKRVVVTVTASTQGIKLPVGVAGLEVEVYSAPTVGVKVYPGTGARIGAASTNAAVTLAAAKASKYVAISATNWRVLTGA